MYPYIQVCRKCCLRSQKQRKHNYKKRLYKNKLHQTPAHLNNMGSHDQVEYNYRGETLVTKEKEKKTPSDITTDSVLKIQTSIN